LKIIIDGKEQIFEFELKLEENYYNRYEIKDFLNQVFESNKCNIKCDIQSSLFVFSSDDKSCFRMENNETSILGTLGFNKNSYFNKNIYSAENPHQLGDNIFYLVIENISEKPLFCIDNDDGEITKLQTIEHVNIDHLIIKFYKTDNDLIKNNKNYKFFFDTNHQITFEFTL
jgi:hypothetical protein